MFKEKTLRFFIIIFSSLLISITMFRSGLKYQFGIGFWGPNGHDAIWHLSLINQLKDNIPPHNPVFSGTILKNYHWGFDLLVAVISKITHINPSILYFQILPFIFAITIGFLSYKLAFLITKNKNTSIFFVLLNYFAGSFGWIFTLIKNHQIGGESLFWSMQSASSLLNPPFSLSLILLLFGLIIWQKFHLSSSLRWPIFIALIFSLLSGIKVYGGILIGLSLSFYFLFNLVFQKKFSKFNFLICLITGILSLVILYFLGVLSGEQLLEFKPFWFINSMIQSVDKLYFPKLASFQANQSNFLIGVILEIILIFVFLIGNLGLRILSLPIILSKFLKQKISDFDKLIFFLLFFSFLIPLLFVQKGTAWNTIQFFYYFLFFINLYLAQFFSKLWLKNKTLVLFLLLITCLTSFGTLKDYFGNPPPSSLPNQEIEALNFLKKQPSPFILTYPYDKFKKNNMSTPIPLYVYETTAYVSAFSGKNTFLEDEMNLDIMGVNWQIRRKEEEKFFTSKDKFFSRGFLINNQIDYIYLVGDQQLPLSELDLQVNKIFDNGQVRIYKVQK